MTPQEEENLANFDRVDFEAWNGPDWDLFRQLHTDDVVVEWTGQHTEGIEAHVEMAKAAIEQTGGAQVTAHTIKIAQGEWTAVVGELAGGALTMVTLSRWRNGAIAEEHIWMNSPPENS